MYCFLQSAFWWRAVQCGSLCHDFQLIAAPFRQAVVPVHAGCRRAAMNRRCSVIGPCRRTWAICLTEVQCIVRNWYRGFLQFFFHHRSLFLLGLHRHVPGTEVRPWELTSQLVWRHGAWETEAFFPVRVLESIVGCLWRHPTQWLHFFVAWGTSICVYHRGLQPEWKAVWLRPMNVWCSLLDGIIVFLLLLTR